MDRSDEELIAAYVRGDETIFGTLVERHLGSVYSFVQQFVGDAQEAEDITQDTFVKAWKSALQYRVEVSKFKTWLLRIARNTAVDFLRKRKAIPLSYFDTDDGKNVLAETVEDTLELADELFAKTEDVTFVAKMLQTLPPDGREVLVLHYTNGLTFLEIGEMLSEPLNTVKSRHYRAVRQLRKSLAMHPHQTQIP